MEEALDLSSDRLLNNNNNAPIINDTIFVLTFHILLTLISRSLQLLSFSVSFVLTFESSGMAISISRHFIMQYSIRPVC